MVPENRNQIWLLFSILSSFCAATFHELCLGDPMTFHFLGCIAELGMLAKTETIASVLMCL